MTSYSTFTAASAVAGCPAHGTVARMSIQPWLTGCLLADCPVTSGWVGLVGHWQQSTGFRSRITPSAYGRGVS